MTWSYGPLRHVPDFHSALDLFKMLWLRGATVASYFLDLFSISFTTEMYTHNGESRMKERMKIKVYTVALGTLSPPTARQTATGL